MGRRPAAAGVAHQAAACPVERRSPSAAQRARRTEAAAVDLSALGLVRRRPVAILEMTRGLLFSCACVLLWLGVASSAARQTSKRPRAAPPAHAESGLFSHSENCIACHNNLVTSTGEDVSIGSMWRATIMANSGRDPYFHASVRRETIDHRSHDARIQDECASCHQPMAQRLSRAAGGQGEVFAHLSANGGGEPTLSRLAADSVSCTVCHQIAPDALGTRASFNAGFVVKPTPPDGARLIYGPYAIDAGRR